MILNILWTAFGAVVLLVLSWYWLMFRNRKLNTIPGPRTLPLVGNALEIGSSPEDFLNNLLRYRHQYGNIFIVYMGPAPYVVVSDPEMLEQILSSNTNITKGIVYDYLKPWLGDGLLISTGKKWKTRRKMITPTFHFKILEKFMQVFNRVGSTLVEKLAETNEKPVNIYPFINLYSLDVICETSMGIKIEALKQHNRNYVSAVRDFLEVFIRRMFSAWKRFYVLFRFSSQFKTYQTSLSELHNFSLGVIRERRSQWSSYKEIKNEDGTKEKIALLDMLLQSESANKLTDSDIQEEIDTFIFEGHDTVTSGISFALYALSVNPQVQSKLYEEITATLKDDSPLTMQVVQEMKYLDMFIKEAQRMYPSVPAIMRSLEESCVLGGYEIPKGTSVTLFFYATHHLEEHFPDPYRFEPERFLPENQAKRHNFCYVPFSAGPRNCIGQKFAIMEMKSAVIKILQEFEILPVREKKIKLGMAAILQSYSGIYIKLKPRNKKSS